MVQKPRSYFHLGWIALAVALAGMILSAEIRAFDAPVHPDQTHAATPPEPLAR